MLLGRSDDFGYGVSPSENYPNVCVFEYVCELAYLWGNVRECCHLLFCSCLCVLWCVLSYVLSGVVVFALLLVGNRYAGLCAELLTILNVRNILNT